MLRRLQLERFFFFKTVSTFEMGQDSLYRLPRVREIYMVLSQNRIVIFLSLCVWFLMNLNVTGFLSVCDTEFPRETNKKMNTKC